jgi:allophanate hydrolase subunit 2
LQSQVIEATVSVGTVVAKANADVAATGSEMGTVATGTVTITADCVVVPTGSSITITTTSAGVVTWNEINLNASQTWTNVAA